MPGLLILGFKPPWRRAAADRPPNLVSRNRLQKQTTKWRADPLTWGHGPRVFEMFPEPTCPLSVQAFGKLDDLLKQSREDRLTVKIRLQSQSWHMYSGVIVTRGDTL